MSETWFINHYECERCATVWDDEWDCACDDPCPTCETPMEPYESEEVSDG